MTKALLFGILFSIIALIVTPKAARADAVQQTPVTCEREPACLELVEAALQRAKTDRQAALAMIQDAYQKYPDPRLCYNLGRLLHQLQRPIEAVEQYRCFLESGTETRREILTKARTYLEQAKREAASLAKTTPPPAAQPAPAPPATDTASVPLPPMTLSTPPPAAQKPGAQVEREAASLPKAPPPPAAQPAPAPPSLMAVATSTPTQKKPIYKKWWFWTAIAGGTVLVATGLGVGLGLAAQPRMLQAPDGVTVIPYSF